LPTLDRNLMEDAASLERGAYVLADIGNGKPELILMASGSEVSLIVDAGFKLAAEGVNVRLVSFPSWELFEQQDETYRSQVILPEVKARLAVEAGSTMGWERWVGDRGDVIGIDRFGASAPYKTIYKEYGLTPEAVIEKARAILENNRESN
jgi:transketolase